MKKILSLLTIISLSLVLVGCKNKGYINEKSLDNFTMERTINGEEVYTIKKNGYSYIVIKDGSEQFYNDFGNGSYVYTTETGTRDVLIEVDEPVNPTTVTVTPTTTQTQSTTPLTTTRKVKKTVTETYEYVKSVKTTVDLSLYTEALNSLKKSDLKDSEFVNLVGNSFLSSFLSGVLIDNKLVDVKSAYDKGIITLTKASLNLDGSKKPLSLTIEFNYASNEYSVKYDFTKFGTTKVSVPEEAYEEKEYRNLLSDKNPVLEIKYKGIGTVKIQLLANEADFKNAVMYFIYLRKNYFYYKAKIDEKTDVSLSFGASSKTLNKTISTKKGYSLKNVRGVLSLAIQDSSNKNTSQLILNLTDNSATYDQKGYTPIGVVVDGFEVLDRLVSLGEKAKGTKVSLSLSLNGVKYIKPTFTK